MALMPDNSFSIYLKFLLDENAQSQTEQGVKGITSDIQDGSEMAMKKLVRGL
jgi:hypothetical protein